MASLILLVFGLVCGFVLGFVFCEHANEEQHKRIDHHPYSPGRIVLGPIYNADWVSRETRKSADKYGRILMGQAVGEKQWAT